MRRVLVRGIVRRGGQDCDCPRGYAYIFELTAHFQFAYRTRHHMVIALQHPEIYAKRVKGVI